MPYMKIKRGSKICIFKKGSNGKPIGKTLGCHDSEGEANRQIAAVYANEGVSKAVSLDERRAEVYRAFEEAFVPKMTQESTQPSIASTPIPWIAEIFMDFVIVEKGQDYFKVPYHKDGDDLGFVVESEWEEVKLKKKWVPVENSLKAIGKTDDEFTVSNYIILWGSPQVRDLEGVGSPRVNLDGSRGEFFTPETSVESEFTKSGKIDVDWEHGADPDNIGNSKVNVLGYVDWSTAETDDTGILVKRVLNRRHSYMRWLETLIEDGLVGTSSQAVTGGVKKSVNGQIEVWPLRRDSLTVNPMEPRMLAENPIVLEALKALNLLVNSGDTTPGVSKGVLSKGGLASQKAQSQGHKPISINLGGEMKTLLEAIKALVPGLTDEQLTALAAVISLQGEPDPVQKTIEPTVTTEVVLDLLTKAGIDIKALQNKAEPKPKTEPLNPPSYEFGASGDPNAEAVKGIDAAYTMRFGTEVAEKRAVFEDVLGKDYRNKILFQNRAFSRYLKGGETNLDREEAKALKTQIYPLEFILDSIKGGMTVEEIKTTMIESQGDLGGYAVPPNIQSEIITRIAGLTAVRQAGATVVTLAAGNSVEAPEYTGADADHRYAGALRGQWGNETKVPGAVNATVGMVTINADVYTYKVPMSQSLVEDAANLVSLVIADISTTLAIDEDEAFLIGNGVGRPLGVLPGATNALGLTEKTSGNAALLTVAGVRKLKRGIPTQYRPEAVWVGNSDTFGAIEAFVSTTGQFIFPDLTESDMLLNRRVFESEVMPDITNNTYPLLFGNFSGYWIIERMGLSIQRFQDSNTGPNVVEYHVRRRVGGRLVKPWMFTIQKVAA